MSSHPPKSVVLIILDGYGVAPAHEGNAITRAKTPNMDALIRKYPAMTIRAAGLEVGLSRGEMGNSEVGHLSIGSGRVFYQNRPRIDQEIARGSFFDNKALKKAAEHTRKNSSRLHLLGLVSHGGVHSHQDHLYALLNFAKREDISEAYIHAILDGRDTVYNSGLTSIKLLEEQCRDFGVGKIATLMGRYYAMDRDNRWDREERAYRAIVDGIGPTANDPIKAIEASYAKKVYDEEFIPTVITKGGKPVAMIREGDAVIFFNFRADRARQLTHAFVDTKFVQFERGERVKDLAFVTLMEYEKGLPVDVALPSEDITTCLAKVWSDEGLRQLHIAETEKYAHVTFFFNGMREEEYPREDRVLIQSPKVATYDLQPEMSAKGIAKRIIEEVAGGKYDGIIMNFANPDMVGHTGKLKPTIAGVEAADAAVGMIVEAVVSRGGVVIITADHGNAEELINLQTGEMDKEHATNPVPLIICGPSFEGQVNEELAGVNWDLSFIQPTGMLADVAPTVLKIMGIRKPSGMTGQSLL